MYWCCISIVRYGLVQFTPFDCKKIEHKTDIYCGFTFYCGGLILALFAVIKTPRNLKPRNIKVYSYYS